MFGVAMIRKQLYITEAQEEALKAQARSLGVSEAELARRILGVSRRNVPRNSSALARSRAASGAHA
jgi:hypothetical protein